MLRKFGKTQRSRLATWRVQIRRKGSERVLHMNNWLRTKTEAIPPNHRKVYSMIMVALLGMATLWNIYTIIFKK